VQGGVRYRIWGFLWGGGGFDGRGFLRGGTEEKRCGHS